MICNTTFLKCLLKKFRHIMLHTHGSKDYRKWLI